MLNHLAGWWCRHFHGGIYWPMRGRYRCAVCLRSFDVPWEHEPARPARHPDACTATLVSNT